MRTPRTRVALRRCGTVAHLRIDKGFRPLPPYLLLIVPVYSQQASQQVEELPGVDPRSHARRQPASRKPRPT